MKSNKSTQFKTSKENFIDFLASATPEEVSEMIAQKGKAKKLIEPMIFFKNNEEMNKA